MQNAAYDANQSGAPSGQKINQQTDGSVFNGASYFPSPTNQTNDHQKRDESHLHSPGKKSEMEYDDRMSIDAEKAKLNPPSHWHAYAAGLTGGLLFVGAGCIFGWTSASEDPFVNGGYVDPTTWGWIAGITPFGAMFGPIPAGLLTDRYGRKPLLMAGGALYVISWVLIGLATGAPLLLIGRFISGLALGGTVVVMPLYINEITTDKMRPTLGSMIQLLMAFGLLLSYAVGPYVKPVILAGVCGVWPVLFIIIFFRMPESPYVLVCQGDLKGAAEGLAWLRGQTETEVAKELDSFQIISDKIKAENFPFWHKVISVFTERGNRKAFILSIALATFAQGNGMTPLSYFTQSIFASTGTSMDPAISTIILGSVKVAASVGCVAFTKCFSMKTLLVVSAFGMAASHGVLGYYFFAKEQGDVSEIAFLPLFGLLSFTVLYCVGFGSLPYAVSAELLGAGNATAVALSLCITYVWGMASLVTWFFKPLLALLGQAGTFFFFGSICIFAGLFVLVFIPNTRNKSLQEIRHFLDKRTS